MTADEMFEELGYKKTLKNKNYIGFEREGERKERIYFDKDKKCFSKVEFYMEAGDIYMDEFRAIFRQCRELGWLE